MNRFDGLTETVFKRDVRPTLEASFSTIFLGKLKILLEYGRQGGQYTYLKKPGVAVIHLDFSMIERYTPTKPIPPISNPWNLRVAKELKVISEGFSYHEIGHLLYTDMTGELIKAIDPKYKPFEDFIKDTMNILEDPKMEKLMSKDIIYKFTKPYFRLLTKLIFHPQAKKYKDDGKVEGFLNYILLWLRCGPKLLTAHNAMFDSLVPKGIYDKIRECHRENDGTERAKKQIAFAIWLIEELGLKATETGDRVTPERPVIILVDKTSSGRPRQQVLKPKSLPPVSIVEDSDEEDDKDGDGESPDADVVDLRKNKSKKKKKDDETDNGSSGQSSEKEDEEDEEDEKDADGESEKKDAEGSSDDTDEEEDGGEGGEDGEDGEDDGESDSQSSNSDDQSGESQAGKEKGPTESVESDDPDFEWEFGNENPIDIMEENGLLSSPDEGLESAIALQASAGESHAYDAKINYEVTNAESADSAFSDCASALGYMPAALADVIKELKTESASYDRHFMADGEEIDIDDYLDVYTSGEKTLDIYRDEIPGREITDLAVSVLVDCSGSMYGKKSHLAYSASVLVALACEEADVPCELEAFSTGGVLYVKHFDEKLDECHQMIGMLYDSIRGCYANIAQETVCLWGGTELEEALPLVISGLHKYDEKQAKLLFVITDGDTGDVSRTGKLIREARNDGTVVIGIGVGVSEDNLRYCFEHCKSFDQSSLAKLPEYVAQQIEEAISSNNFDGY